MPLSELEKLRLSRGLLQKYRWRLLDKEGSVLPPEGKYYFEISPHDRSAVGSIAHLPNREEIESGFQPAPNSMGLVFMVSAPDDGRIVLEVEGRFDLEHAYIPNYADQDRKLVRDGGQIRIRQDLADAYKRYTVVFTPSRFEIDTHELPVAPMGPTGTNTLRDAIQQHLDTIEADPRVYRKLVLDARSKRPKWWLDWSHDIIDQSSLNEAVKNALFEPRSGPLPYTLDLQCRVRSAPASMRGDAQGVEYLVEVFLVNNTTREVANGRHLYHHRVMDVNLRIRVVAGEHRRMRFRIAPEEYRYEPVQEIDGYGVTCALVRDEDGALVTDSLPAYEQQMSEAPGPEEVGMRESPEFARLAQDPLPILEDFLRAMQTYARDWAAAILGLENGRAPSVEHARRDRKCFEDEIERVAVGIELLRNDIVLKRAFCLMNEAMLETVTIQRKSFRAWRLFQLGFILTQIADIAARAAQVAPEPTPADVLWFPTGGGKTEAYLGLIAMAMIHQRMKGRQYGVTAWMRFPLRMLSVQQFQRLAYVVGAANRIRVREQLPGFAFSIGYFTGQGTPNRISSREQYAAQDYLPQMLKRTDWKDKLRFIDTCPHCTGQVQVSIAAENFRIKHVCTNEVCWSNQEFTTARANLEHKGELGIFVSDEECYRYLPTVLVGTLDKIVVLGHNQNFRNFFGAVNHFCPDHGFITSTKCEHPVVSKSGGEWNEPTTCPNNSRTSAVRTSRVGSLIDPGFSFLINDELHLLKEDLGNFDSHYESAMESIQCSYPGGRPSKVLAATATIRDFEHHVHHLYVRAARRFPAGGMALDSSFYSRVKRDPESGTPLIRRIYVGAQPSGTQANMIAEWICDANDRYHQLLAEFVIWLQTRPRIATDELGLDSAKASDAIEHIGSMLTPSLLYVRRMTDADHVERRFQTENEALQQSGMSERVFARLDSQTSLADIQKVIARVQSNDAHDPIHEMVATSVVSHGVDIERINIEFFIGWPTSTAEYIQASSRSGRVHTGIVLVALNSRKLFEATAFSHFREYHRFIERLVEAVPINRFAPNVLTRTLPGIFNALVLNWARRRPWGGSIRHSAQSLSDALNQVGAADEFGDMVVQAYGFERAEKLRVFNARQIEEAKVQAAGEAKRLVALFRRVQARYATEFIGAAIEGMYGYGPMESLRDIERQVAVRPATLPDQQVLDAIAEAQ